MTFQPGQSGNPNGRASSKPWKDAITRALKRRENGDDPAALEKLAENLLKAADNGDMAAIKELGDRLDGRPTQVIAGDSENPLIPLPDESEIVRRMAFLLAKQTVIDSQV